MTDSTGELPIFLAALWAGVKAVFITAVKFIATIGKTLWAIGKSVFTLNFKGLGGTLKNIWGKFAFEVKFRFSLPKYILQLAKTLKGSNGVVIGRGMGFVEEAAKMMQMDTYKAWDGFSDAVKLAGEKFANKLSMIHNKTWIKTVMDMKLPIYNNGMAGIPTTSIFYNMEFRTAYNYKYMF